MGMMGNEPSNLSRLPGAKALMHGLMLIPNLRWGSCWESRAVDKGLAEVTPAQGLLLG